MELVNLSGIGKSRLKALNNAGIFSCEDLIKIEPKKYYNFLNPAPYVNDNTYKMIKVKVVGDVKVARIKKNFIMTTVKVKDSYEQLFTCI